MSKSRNINGKKVTFHPDVILHEPREVVHKSPRPLLRFSVFPRLDEQLSHAIYDIEIANSNAMMKGKK